MLLLIARAGTVPDAADELQRSVLLTLAAVLVLAMAFGAAVFYLRPIPGATRVLLASAGLVALLWTVCCYGLSFGPALIPGFLGNPVALFTGGGATPVGATVLRSLAFAFFQGTIAILAVTIVSSVVADRVRLVPWLVLVGFWTILVYSPLAYSVFNAADGWLFDGLQINDQAGGTVIHVSAGAGVLALLIVLGRAPGQDGPRGAGARPRMTLLGVALLWIGAFGLNLGSEGVVDGLFGTIVLNTLITPAVAIAAWSMVELLRDGRPTTRGAAYGAVAGIVAITPACNILTPLWATALGLLAGAVCAVVVGLQSRLRLGSGFAAVGVHLVGGIVGLAYIGLFGSGIGWKDTGQPDGLADQAGAAFGVGLYSFMITLVVASALQSTMRLRRVDVHAQ